jgi:hypothetical protein
MIVVRIVVAATGAGIKIQNTCSKSFCGFIGIAAHAAIDSDAGIRQRKAGTTANTATDQRIDTQACQKAWSV